ncbi:response regulator transcription factor [Geofilum sp. OHC36d9]|uniref:response regulator transcription factor n=1 Tax=Geofilum sp. OHC36d9 TaxID=3458413 RepID=UPI004033CAB9
MNALIIEDEKNLANEIGDFLNKEHIISDIANTGKEASEMLAVNLYDFVLLDLGLPDYDGLDLLREAKKLNVDAAFIIITARGAIADRITGLDTGADDYLPKPFALAELYARMQAVARRKFKVETPEINAGDFIINLQARKVMFNNIEVELTKKEYDLLQYLLLNKNKVLSRIQLYEHIWGNILDDQYDSNFIDVHIKNLRKKLGQYQSADWLETVRGIGYKAVIQKD